MSVHRAGGAELTRGWPVPLIIDAKRPFLDISLVISKTPIYSHGVYCALLASRMDFHFQHPALQLIINSYVYVRTCFPSLYWAA